MGSAGGGLEECGINIAEVLDLENSTGYYSLLVGSFAISMMDRLTRIGTILGETTVHGDTVSFKVLAKQLFATTAVETLSAKLRVVCNNTITDFKTLDLGSDGSDFADCLVAYSHHCS